MFRWGLSLVILIVSGQAYRASECAALGASGKVRILQIRHTGSSWNPRPQAVSVLAQEVEFRTSIETASGAHSRDLEAPDLFDFPILMFAGGGAFPRLTDAQIERLRHHLEAGGFLIVDNAGESEGSFVGFDRSVRRMMKRVFPERSFKPIPSEHVLFRSFFRLEYPSGRNLRKGYMEGISIVNRVAVVYTPNDLSGAVDRDRFGSWAYDLMPGTEGQREAAIRLGVNLVMYGLCLHYKDDQVHLKYLLKKRNWRIKPPENP
jgi:hypothetical protein